MIFASLANDLGDGLRTLGFIIAMGVLLLIRTLFSGGVGGKVARGGASMAIHRIFGS